MCRLLRAVVVALGSLIASCKSSMPPTHEQTVRGVRFLELFPNEAEDTSPLVIELHGLGSTPERMARTWQDFPLTAEIAFPRGFTPLADGWSWFDWAPAMTDDQLADAAAAAEAKLWPAIVELAHGRKVIVVGFSQGAVVAYALAIHHPEIALVVPIAGRCPTKLLPHGPVAPIYALHGTLDDEIAISYARTAVAALRAVGSQAELEELPGIGHSAGAIRPALFARLRTAIASAPASR